MKKIGIYGASFDPITNVHLWTASTIAHRKKLDQVIFLPSSRLRTDKTSAISDKHRLRLIELALENNSMFSMSTYELEAPLGKHYTYFAMEHFKQKYPHDELYFIMGADCLKDIAENKWRFAEELIQNHQFIIMARDHIDMLAVISRSPLLRNTDDGRFHLIDKGLAMEISSSYIRDEFARGGEPRYLLPESCYHYIQHHRLYRKMQS